MRIRQQRGQIAPIGKLSNLLILIRKSELDFLFAMAARFGYGLMRVTVVRGHAD